ncbi:alpha-galactosidase [Paenibacillus amylolyticus]|nr:alpha-galactosidase [Paenibacillus amylolyticus]WFR61356.1 alpha-galactosidase [Paenibacillus amylolyticus]
MNDFLTVTVIMESGKRVVFPHISLFKSSSFQQEDIKLIIGASMPFPITVNSEHPEAITSIEYTFYTQIRNYHSVIVPDSGRWFFNSSHLVSFWRSFREMETGVDDTKLPMFLFTGRDHYTELAAGIIGENYETSFKLIEPESNRALNVHTGHIAFQIKRGTDKYSIPSKIFKDPERKSITEYVYYWNEKNASKSWVSTIRDFTGKQRELYNLVDPQVESTMYPLWCTWADWHSNDITSDIIVDNVRKGVDLGIRNFIIDDGWFGPGLDNDYDVPLNIGDWEPDPDKIPDMNKLVKDIKALGAHPIIWCAPHAVALQAKCYPQREHLLIAGTDGIPVINPTQFYSLCFMSAESREIMADICVNFIKEWDFDGAKYDLFNWVPNMKCSNPNHQHDTSTMLEGLEQTLALIEQKTRQLKPEYIVELKQNYGTPTFSRFGTMMRAGDGPYDPQSNYLRTLFVQGYTPFAVNDYQIITKDESPRDTAAAVIKMIAAGIPAYSVDFSKLSSNQLLVIQKWNEWYNQHILFFMNHRKIVDADAHYIQLDCGEFEIIILVDTAKSVTLRKDTILINGTYDDQLFVKLDKPNISDATIQVLNCYHQENNTYVDDINHGWKSIEAPTGSLINIKL